MTSRFALLLLLGIFAFCGAMACGQETEAVDEPFLPPVFGDNMVLQRGIRAPIWGWTTPGETVTVRMNGKEVRAVAGRDGRWMARLGPFEAGGPHRLSVTGPEGEVVFENVLVGDVWIASGQSNMQWALAWGVDNQAQEIAGANHPNLRLFTVPNVTALEPQKNVRGQWQVTRPDTIPNFSAVAYFFGQHLHKELGVPIGLINTSWGGTIAEAWTSAEALQKMPDFRPALAQVERQRIERMRGGVDFDRQMAEWWEKNDPGSKAGAGWEEPDFDAAGWKAMTLPALWEGDGLPDFDGVVWFRRTFDVPASAAGKEAVLSLGPIDDRDTTWVNGVKVGETGQYNAARSYRVPAGLLRPGRNLIAVRVLDTGGGGGLYGKPEEMFVEVLGGERIPLTGEWTYKDSVALAKAAPVPQRTDNNPNVVTVLYNSMIAPLVPFGIKGAIWYQGESNAGRAYQYRELLPTLIKDWRTRWGQGDFPFLIVQLANFMERKPEPGEDAWAELREAQLMTARRVPKVGLAVTIDIGDAQDIHPRNKQDVGKRLALAALSLAYGKKVVPTGPIYKSLKREGSALRLTFDSVGSGLTAPGGALKGFAIAGPDRRFVWADARIEGNTVVVSSPQVAEPVAVRYAWAANPEATLFNKEGLPASPFRTDDWPEVTANNR